MRSRQAVSEEAAVRVITYRLFREAQQSFGGVQASVTFLDQAELLVDAEAAREAVKRLAHSSQSVHLFTTAGLLDHPVATFHLASLLWLPDFPRDLPRFKAAFVHSAGYGAHEVMKWHPEHVEELMGALDLHHHQRVEAPRLSGLRLLLPASAEAAWAIGQLAPWA